MKTKYHSLSLLILFSMTVMLSACNIELQHELDEDQANEIMLVLLNAGLDAAKKRDSVDSEKWMILVKKDQLDRGLNLLITSELPREKSKGFSEIFQKDGFIPSDLQEQAKYTSALSGELQETLEADDSILRARVHIHMQAKNKYRRHPESDTASASVFIKVLRNSEQNDILSDEAIKELVANSVANLDVENISVVRSISKIHTSMEKTIHICTQSKTKFILSEKLWFIIPGIILIAGLAMTLVAVFRIKNPGRNLVKEVSE